MNIIAITFSTMRNGDTALEVVDVFHESGPLVILSTDDVENKTLVRLMGKLLVEDMEVVEGGRGECVSTSTYTINLPD